MVIPYVTDPKKASVGKNKSGMFCSTLLREMGFEVTESDSAEGASRQDSGKGELAHLIRFYMSCVWDCS